MKKVFTIVSLGFLFSVSLFSHDFAKEIKENATSLWGMAPKKFKTTFGPSEIYKWKTALKTTLTYSSKGAKTELLFFEHPIDKANFKFKSKQLQGMSLTFAEPSAISDKETYLKYSSNLKRQIAGLGKFSAAKVMKHKFKGRYRYTYSWKSPMYYISQKCSYTSDSKKTFHPGKIKFSIFLRVTPKASSKKTEKAPAVASEADSSLNVDENGNCNLQVPMLEEESPEECVYICAKRIFAYYKTVPRGRNWKRVSDNLRLNVKSARGLKQVFASIASECRCHVKKLVSTSVFDNFNSIIKFIRAYNLQAAKMGKNKINFFKVNSFKKLLKVMDEDVLVSTRNNPKKVELFKSRTCKEINAKKPVLWVVFLGVIKEKPEPLLASGGYVRLIVGYNSKTNEVIYSDNWGKGHELKKMSWEKAWAITLSVLAVTIKK